MQHLSHLEIIIHHASPATGECVVLFNGCHWHNSSSYHPQPVTKLLLLQQGYIFLHLCGDVMCVFLPVRRFAGKKGWFLWVYGGSGKFHCGAIWSFLDSSAASRNVLTFSFNSAKYGFQITILITISLLLSYRIDTWLYFKRIDSKIQGWNGATGSKILIVVQLRWKRLNWFMEHGQ